MNCGNVPDGSRFHARISPYLYFNARYTHLHSSDSGVCSRSHTKWEIAYPLRTLNVLVALDTVMVSIETRNDDGRLQKRIMVTCVYCCTEHLRRPTTSKKRKEKQISSLVTKTNTRRFRFGGC